MFFSFCVFLSYLTYISVYLVSLLLSFSQIIILFPILDNSTELLIMTSSLIRWWARDRRWGGMSRGRSEAVMVTSCPCSVEWLTAGVGGVVKDKVFCYSTSVAMYFTTIIDTIDYGYVLVLQIRNSLQAALIRQQKWLWLYIWLETWWT